MRQESARLVEPIPARFVEKLSLDWSQNSVIQAPLIKIRPICA